MNNRARHGLTTLVNNLPTDRRWLMHGQNQVFRRAFWTRNHRTVGAFVQIALPVNLPQVALAFRSKRPGSCRDRLDCELTIGTGSRVQLARRAVVSRRYNMNLAQGSAGHAVHGRTRNPVAASPTHLLLPRDAHRQTPDYHAQNRQPSYFHFGSSDRANNRTVASRPASTSTRTPLSASRTPTRLLVATRRPGTLPVPRRRIRTRRWLHIPRSQAGCRTPVPAALSRRSSLRPASRSYP